MQVVSVERLGVHRINEERFGVYGVSEEVLCV